LSVLQEQPNLWVPTPLTAQYDDDDDADDDDNCVSDYSFYSTNKKVAYSTFIPRIKLPPKRTKPLPACNGGPLQASKSKLIQEDECMPNSLFDYDAYDAQVFQLPPVHTTR
jgi:hypothetical protein